MRVDPLEFIETEEAIIALLRFHLRGRGSGVALDVEEACTYWLRDGKIRHVEQYGSKRPALEAAGLRE